MVETQIHAPGSSELGMECTFVSLLGTITGRGYIAMTETRVSSLAGTETTNAALEGIMRTARSYFDQGPSIVLLPLQANDLK